MNWSIEHIEKLAASGKIRGYIDNTSVKEDITGKPSNRGNLRVEIDGIKFQSIKEGRRYEQLRLLEKQGYISDLRLQVGYELNQGGTHSFMYYADFEYISSGKQITEDVKPFDKKSGDFLLSKTFKKKAKLMKKIHGIEVKIT